MTLSFLILKDYQSKDTGKIIPSHGGLLDRVDGMIFAFPFAYLAFIKNYLNEKKIVILGWAGSIGQNTLKIIKK